MFNWLLRLYRSGNKSSNERGRKNWSLERLEQRDCPAVTFQWNGPANTNGLWNVSGNWTTNGGAALANDFPGDTTTRTDDIVQLDGGANGQNNQNIMLNVPVTIGTLNITGGYTSSLHLNAALTVNNGGTMAANAAIWSDNVNNSLTLESGVFLWTKGVLGYSFQAAEKPFVVPSSILLFGGVLEVNNPANTRVLLADNIVVGSSSALLMANAGTMVLKDDPAITIMGGGNMVFSVSNAKGITTAKGETAQPIVNGGSRDIGPDNGTN